MLKRVVNPFIYDQTEERYMENPTIVPFLEETYAQKYEDIIVLSLLDAYALKLDAPKTLGYVELGANHPISTSSSYLISLQRKCSGILVEANHDLAEELRKHRPNDLVIEAAVVADDSKEVEFVTCVSEHELSSTDMRFVKRFIKEGMAYTRKKVKAINVNEILEIANNRYQVFPLFIDVEGPDADILEAINYEAYRPVIIQIEVSEAILPGNTDRIIDIMTRNSYVLIAHTFTNFIFIDAECL